MNNGTPLSEQKSQKPKTHKSMDGKVTTFPTSKSNAPESAEAACLETEKHEDVKISENDDKHNDEDDKSSAASSSAASGRITKSVTVGTAPTFKSAERAQKRREYYMKLEEKRKAMEAEKAEAEARSKEEQQAAIREMRKNMVFKANPVPNFYYEPPPPKVELKKVTESFHLP
ncbi:Protein WVD2-like 1 [Linum grandiflorum]